MSMEQRSMAFCTQQKMILGWLVTLTVTGQEVLMTVRARKDMFFIWVRDPFHGIPRSNR